METVLALQKYIYVARLRVDTKYLIPEISKNTKLEYILPTTTGPGVCTTSLVDFLVCAHNEFIEKCASRYVLKYGMNNCISVC